MALLVSAILFAIFATSVVMGAWGAGAFLSDIWQMLTLFAASAAFVVAVLRREAREKERTRNTD